jgi:phosphate-selective porin
LHRRGLLGSDRCLGLAFRGVEQRAAVDGGTENNVTLGLSWWLYSNLRITTNWVHANLNGVGREDIAQIRFGLEF